jgi:hypothetical protein
MAPRSDPTGVRSEQPAHATPLMEHGLRLAAQWEVTRVVMDDLWAQRRLWTARTPGQRVWG